MLAEVQPVGDTEGLLEGDGKALLLGAPVLLTVGQRVTVAHCVPLVQAVKLAEPQLLVLVLAEAQGLPLDEGDPLVLAGANVPLDSAETEPSPSGALAHGEGVPLPQPVPEGGPLAVAQPLGEAEEHNVAESEGVALLLEEAQGLNVLLPVVQPDGEVEAEPNPLALPVREPEGEALAQGEGLLQADTEPVAQPVPLRLPVPLLHWEPEGVGDGVAQGEALCVAQPETEPQDEGVMEAQGLGVRVLLRVPLPQPEGEPDCVAQALGVELTL